MEFKAGKELDALVAEKVMGWKKLFKKDYPDSGDWRGLEWMWREREGFMYSEAQSTKPYSTNIAAAWEVVEKLRDDNFKIQEHGTHWKVHFGAAWRGAETVPHAICLVALDVVGL